MQRNKDGEEKGNTGSLYETVKFTSALERWGRPFLLSDRQQEPSGHEYLTWGLTSKGVNVYTEIQMQKFNFPIPLIFVTTTETEHEESEDLKKIYVIPRFHFCLTCDIQ